jgi:hypothetical protein
MGPLIFDLPCRCNLSIAFEIHGAYSVIEAKRCQYGIDVYSYTQMVRLGRQGRIKIDFIPRITIPIKISNLTCLNIDQKKLPMYST